ncbi:MAG: DNA repair protein RadC, partial [Clostridia bacterium]|nr:DNA repair protein RadC [Clostridia bacterium]
MDSLHAGHRARVKQEFLAHGFHENTPPHKILELLLFFCLPQGDTNPLAHELINRFGTLTGVLQAPVEELTQFKGLTENNVVLLKLILPLAQKCLEES